MIQYTIPRGIPEFKQKMGQRAPRKWEGLEQYTGHKNSMIFAVELNIWFDKWASFASSNAIPVPGADILETLMTISRTHCNGIITGIHV